MESVFTVTTSIQSFKFYSSLQWREECVFALEGFARKLLSMKIFIEGVPNETQQCDTYGRKI